MVDPAGRPYTQSLFLELLYKPDIAVYTLKDVDHVYEGKEFKSLKRLYLEMEDVTEYDFANTYLLGWNHWQRLCENKAIRKHIDEWREELEYKLRSQAAKQMIKQAAKGSYQASKWLLDRGWATRGAGRPSQAEKDSKLAQDRRLDEEYGADVVRLFGER